MNKITCVLLCIFYGAYLLKLLAQRRQGITTNVMVKGVKSRRAYWIGVLLTVATYLTCGVQFLSCFFRPYLGEIWLPTGLRVVGLVLTALGDGMFIAAFLTLKDSWRAGIDESQKTELVTDGIYRFSRNPAFVGFDLTYLGCALTLCNGAMLAAGCIAMLMMHLQILEEEKHLEKMFGTAYRDYRRTVRRYL